MANHDENTKSNNWIIWIASLAVSALIYTVIGLIVIPVVLASPFFMGLYSLWQRMSFFNPPQTEADPSIDHYEYHPEQTLFQRILSYLSFPFKILLFPLYVYGLGLKTLIGLPIYPNSIFSLREDSNESYQGLLENTAYDPLLKHFNIQKCFIEMPNHARLHTCEFTPKNLSGDLSKIPHIIYFRGNGARYEDDLQTMCDDAVTKGATVIGFHHSNYGFSGMPAANGELSPVFPRSQSELVEEGVAQVQRLLDKGVDPKLIVLCGHSLGGAIATFVAWHFQQRDVPLTINLYNDRSFSSVANIVSGWIQPTPQNEPQEMAPDSTQSLSQTIIQPLKTAGIAVLNVLIKGILSLSDWNLNAGDTIHRLPQDSWDYIGVDHDEIIPASASIHQVPEIQLTREQTKRDNSPQEQGNIENRHQFFHTKAWTDSIKIDGKEVVSLETRGRRLHMQHHRFLHNPLGQRANEHFHEFVQHSVAGGHNLGGN